MDSFASDSGKENCGVIWTDLYFYKLWQLEFV